MMRRLLLPPIIAILIAATIPVAMPASDVTLASSVADLLDASPAGQQNSSAACALLADQLGAVSATNAPDSTGEAGFMGAPIACARTYDTPGLPTPVMVYTDPQFVARVSGGPPPGQSAERRTVQGRTVFVLPGTQGMPPMLIVDAAPAGVIFVRIADPTGAPEVSLSMVDDMALKAFIDASTNAPDAANRGSTEAQLMTKAEQLKTQLQTVMPDHFSVPDLSLDPVGTQPRCLDIGELLSEGAFIYLSVLVGRQCVATVPLPETGSVDLGGLKAYMEAPEQAFSGEYSTRGVIVLSEHAVMSFHVVGKDSAATDALRTLPLEEVKTIL
ncbi:MAG: hypothetical protein AAFV47_11125 [Pseudomonadota bacterium]